MLIALALGFLSPGAADGQTHQALPVDTPAVRIEIDIHQQLIALGDSSRNTLYRISRYFSMVSEADSSLKYLALCAELNYDVLDALEEVDLAHARTSADWPRVSGQIAEVWRQRHPDGDIDFALKIIGMVYEDQLNRYLIEAAIDTHGVGSEPVAEQVGITNRADSMHMVAIEDWIETHGWPTAEKVGRTQVYSVFIMVLHAGLAHQVEYLPMVEESVRKGDLRKSSVAFLTDKIRVAQGKKQVYGTQMTFNDSTKNYELYPVENFGGVNQRRLEMGLESIENYLEHMMDTYNRP